MARTNRRQHFQPRSSRRAFVVSNDEKKRGGGRHRCLLSRCSLEWWSECGVRPIFVLTDKQPRRSRDTSLERTPRKYPSVRAPLRKVCCGISSHRPLTFIPRNYTAVFLRACRAVRAVSTVRIDFGCSLFPLFNDNLDDQRCKDAEKRACRAVNSKLPAKVLGESCRALNILGTTWETGLGEKITEIILMQLE